MTTDEITRKRWEGMGKLYIQGLSVAVIARQCGVGSQMVYTALDKLGLRKKGARKARGDSAAPT